MARGEAGRKLNVMQCRSTYTTGGGPDKTVLLIGERADRERFNIYLTYMRGADDDDFQIANWARAKGLNINEVIERGRFDMRNVLEINRLIREQRIDIFHARDYKTSVIGFLLGFLNPRMKLVFTAHGWVVDSAKLKLYTWLNLVSLKKYQKLIAVSEATKKFMVDSGVDKEKIVVIYNAIDTELWSRAAVRSTLRSELGIAPASKIVGVVGRLRYEKDIPATLAVAQKVIAARPDTYFTVIGDGPDREQAERSVREMGLEKRILFLGFRNDALNVYAALDLFVSTSLTEGTPNTVLEAMAMEVPVIHTAVGGVPEMITDGYDGILIRPGDVEGGGQAALSVLQDEGRAAQLRARGRETVCARFSFHARMKSIESLYEEVAAHES